MPLNQYVALFLLGSQGMHAYILLVVSHIIISNRGVAQANVSKRHQIVLISYNYVLRAGGGDGLSN